MTASERLLLLLCSDLGDGAAKPLKPAEYRLLRQRLVALNRPEMELNAAILRALGYDVAQAARILTLLERDPADWLQRLAQCGIAPLTRLNPDYPQRLREAMGEDAPLLLYSCGERKLLNRTAVSVVGSRMLTVEGRRTAQSMGRWIAVQGCVLCTGGAVGADTAALDACLEAGGSAILYLPGEMETALRSYRTHMDSGRLTLLSAAPTARFHAGRALQRNRWIHAQGCAVVVCQCTPGKGGSWRGAAENLRNHWSPVFVPADDSAGCRDLRSRGAQVLDWDALQALTKVNSSVDGQIV